MRSVWRAVTVVGAGAVLLAACGGPAEVTVLEAADEAADAGAAEEGDLDAAPDAPTTDAAAEEPSGPDDTEAVDPDDDPERGDPDGEPEPFEPDEVEAAADDGRAAVPDPDLVAAPCAAHEGRELDAFIDLVAPVDEQVTGDEVEIVGCSNVYEATVNWRLMDGDGRSLDEGFTTAACGTGCVGAFRETVPLAAAADAAVVRLEVFWVSPQDGSEQDRQERTIVLD
ncbi:MAG: Gmad2 immunoglobulin-like domain-containing protein [Nitriliruptoraceae bacterium]